MLANPSASYTLQVTTVVGAGMQELQQRTQRVITSWGSKGSHPSETLYKEEMMKIRKDIIDFHGEMVLLENYSSINYTGT